MKDIATPSDTGTVIETALAAMADAGISFTEVRRCAASSCEICDAVLPAAA